jgi:uncharacterized membrane protein HdeD (DUF308 family)
MSVSAKMTGQLETQPKAAAMMGNLTTVLGLLLLGLPLTPATIRATLLGWTLIVAATMQFIWRSIQTPWSSVAVRQHAHNQSIETWSRRIVAGTFGGRK